MTSVRLELSLQKKKTEHTEISKKDPDAHRALLKVVAEPEDEMVIDEKAREASTAKPVCGPVTAKVSRPVAHDWAAEGKPQAQLK